MTLLHRLKSLSLPAIIAVGLVGVILTWMRLTGAGQETASSSAPPTGTRSGTSVRAPSFPAETHRATKTGRDDRRPGVSAGDQSFRKRMEMSRTVKAVAVAADRQMAEHLERYPHTTDDSAARAEFGKRMAAATSPEQRAALTHKFLETADERRKAAEAARTPAVLRHGLRLRMLSGLESFLDLPAYVSEKTEFSSEAAALLVKVVDLADCSAEMNDEAVIAEFSVLNAAIKDLRRRRSGKLPSLPDHGDD